jgi:hypothetical protein
MRTHHVAIEQGDLPSVFEEEYCQHFGRRPRASWETGLTNPLTLVTLCTEAAVGILTRVL